MTPLLFTFGWYDDDKTALLYAARGQWTWRDYHAAVRMSLFSLHGHDRIADSVIDFRGSERDRLPGGLAAHARTFGKRLHPGLSGRAVVIGLGAEAETALGVDGARRINGADGEIRFVDDDDAAQAVLAAWRAGDG